MEYVGEELDGRGTLRVVRRELEAELENGIRVVASRRRVTEGFGTRGAEPAHLGGQRTLRPKP